MKWLQCLLTYGYHEGEEPDITDNDIHLIPQLIDRVLISKINGESHDTVSHDYYYIIGCCFKVSNTRCNDIQTQCL